MGNFTVTVSVAAATRLDFLREYAASLFLNGVTVSGIDPLSVRSGSGISYEDRDEDLRLSPGDSFTVSRLDEGAFRLQILWQSVSIANATWTIHRPLATLVATPGSTVSWVNVTAIDGQYPLPDFTAVLTRDGYWWDQMGPLRPGASSQGHFLFEDRDLDQRLSQGDGFEVSSQPGTYFFSLSWHAGNVSVAVWAI